MLPPTSTLPVLAVTAPHTLFDPAGLLIALGVIVAVAVAAWLLLRKKPAASLPPTEDRSLAVQEAEKAAERARRRAAEGATRIGADGVARALTPAERQQEAEQAARLEAKATQLKGQLDRQADQRAAMHVGLQKTKSEGFVARLGKLFAGKQIDEDLLDQVEEVLFRADLGNKTVQSLLGALKAASSRKELTDASHVWKTLKQKSLELLLAVKNQPIATEATPKPAVIMVVGVNGSGKTTSIGKLAHRYATEGRKVLVAAGDTYRAAAVDQLEVWCQRANVPIFRGKDNADPASVAFGALEQAKADGVDLVIIDTAGRLHTNANLMEELKKVGRVLHKSHPGAPHETLLVLDATMGQNAVKQAELFAVATPLTGIVLTKLDGTAKGGVVLAIAETLGLPVKLIGVGEKMEDLRDFEPEVFIEELFATD
jgi:fused signal recognition particle receptor